MLNLIMVVLTLIYMVSLMILSSGAYRDIAGAQHVTDGAKPGEYSILSLP